MQPGTSAPSDRPGSLAAAAGRSHKISLRLLFLGLPVAVLVAGVWEVIVGVASVGGNPRVTGVRAVFYDLPATLLLLGVVTTSLAFAAKALRGRARGARWGLWLSGSVLLLTLLYIGTNIADTVSTPSSATVNWVVRAAMVPIAATAIFVARRWAR